MSLALDHAFYHRDRAAIRVVVAVERENSSPELSSSSSSSSIGNNSDDDVRGEDEEEVESKLKKNTFDSSVEDLEQALPIRKGISKFYSGKSKSFASLSDAACSSVKNIVKPENPYSRKRKNLLAYAILRDSKGRTTRLPKCPIPCSRSTLTLAGNSIDENGSSPESSWSNGSSVSPQMPWRSFSLVDLQHCGVSANGGTGVSFNLPPLIGKRTNPDEVS